MASHGRRSDDAIRWIARINPIVRRSVRVSRVGATGAVTLFATSVYITLASHFGLGMPARTTGSSYNQMSRFLIVLAVATRILVPIRMEKEMLAVIVPVHNEETLGSPNPSLRRTRERNDPFDQPGAAHLDKTRCGPANRLLRRQVLKFTMRSKSLESLDNHRESTMYIGGGALLLIIILV